MAIWHWALVHAVGVDPSRWRHLSAVLVLPETLESRGGGFDSLNVVLPGFLTASSGASNIDILFEVVCLQR